MIVNKGMYIHHYNFKINPIKTAAKLFNKGYITSEYLNNGYFLYSPCPGKSPIYVHVTQEVYRLVLNLENTSNKISSTAIQR